MVMARAQNPSATMSTRCQDTLVIAALLLNGINVGMNVGLLGPTLPDLAIQTGSSIPDMKLIFIFSSIAYMAGSVLCGLLLGRFEGYLVVSLTLILQALATAIAPWCTNLKLLTFFISVAYFFSTVVIAGMMYLCFQLEQTQARTMMQIVFLLFNVGKGIVPFVVAPFLVQETVTKPTPESSEGRSQGGRYEFEFPANFSWPDNAGSDAAFVISPSAVRDVHAAHSNVGYGYAIVAGFSLFLSALYMVVAFRTGFHLWASPAERDRKDTDPEHRVASISRISSRTTSRVHKVAVLLSFFVMNLLQCGMESVDTGLIMSFLSEYLDRGKEMGVLMSAVYQGVKVAACIVVVLTIKVINPSPLFLIDIILMLSATSLMAITIQLRYGDWLLWTSFVLLAMGMSNSYATLASWLKMRYAITGAITGMLTISFGLSSMVLPTVTIALLDHYGAVMFPLVLLGSSVLCFIVYCVTHTLMREACYPPADLEENTSSSPALSQSQPAVGERHPLLEGATRAKPIHTAIWREERTAFVANSAKGLIDEGEQLAEFYPYQSVPGYQPLPTLSIASLPQHNTISMTPSAPNEHVLHH